MLVCENVVEIEARKMKNLCFLLPQSERRFPSCIANHFRRVICDSRNRPPWRSVDCYGLTQRYQELCRIFYENGTQKFLVQPSRANAFILKGKSDSPIWKRGHFSRSNTITRRPACASKVAAVLPAGPPPMIA